MILPAIIYTLKGKILLGLVAISTTLLAAGEVNSNQTLIIVAIITMVGTLFTGIMTLISARISAAGARISAENRTGLAELSKGIDGVAHELKAAKEEGTVARVDAAGARGQLKEREAEVARQGAAALAKEKDTPMPVTVENQPEKAAKVEIVGSKSLPGN